MIVSYACPTCSTFIAACSADAPIVGSTVCPKCHTQIIFKNAGASLKDKIKVSQYPIDLILLSGDGEGYGKKRT